MKLCAASVAKGNGSHLRCLLEDGHKGDCDTRIRNPRGLRTSELMRHASAMLRDVGTVIAEELLARALLLDQVKAKAEIAHRRGYKLPRELVDLLDLKPADVAS